MEQPASSSSNWSRLKRVLRRELSPEWIWFNGTHPKRFATLQFNIPFQPVSWIVIRLVLAFYLNVWLAILVWKWGTKPDYPRGSDSKAKLLLFASNWAYILACLYFLFSAISTLVYHMDTAYKDSSTTVNKEQQKITDLIECGGYDPCKRYILPWYFKFTWLIQNCSYPSLILTSFMRWFVDTGEPYQFATSAADSHVHGIGVLFVIIDIIIIASPYRLQHVIYPMILLLVYYVFTLIYFFAGGTNEHHLFKDMDGDTYLYRGKLDWGEYPRTTAFFLVLAVFLAMPLAHLSIYLIFKLKGLFVDWYYEIMGSSNK